MLTPSACGGISTGLKLRIRADEAETSTWKRLLSPERKRPSTEEGEKQWRLSETRGNLIVIFVTRSLWTKWTQYGQ